MENHFDDYCFIWLGAAIREVAMPDVKLLHEKTNGLFVMSFPTDPQREMFFLCILPLLIPGWTKMSIRSLKCHSSPSPLRRGGERRVPYGLGGGTCDISDYSILLSPLQRLLLGIRLKIAIIEKIRSARVPSVLSHNTRRPLWRRESIISFSGNAGLLGAYKTFWGRLIFTLSLFIFRL